MQELEKILEEIGQRVNYYKEHATLEYVDICAGLREAEGIIRKHMNDGWIPVECKLPKTNGIYNVARHIDGRFISDSSYFDGQNTWHSDNRVNHSRPYLTDVIAWHPLPEPYCPEQSETCKYTGGSCCWPIDQCGECPNNQGK